MNALANQLSRAMSVPGTFTRETTATLLGLTNSVDIARLHAAAYVVKVRHSGKIVSLRGIIEMGNVCTKNCFYCGIRRENDQFERFQLDETTILRSTQSCIDMGYGSIVLQSGEIESAEHTAFIERLLQRITILSDGQLGITLSLGEQSADTYARWRAAGAHRYLLRIETSNPTLYAKLHPANHSFERRVECLRHLRANDYQVGTGVMCALPGQTLDDLAGDILFFREMDVDMIGMGPYIPHHDTPLGRDFPVTPDYAAEHLRLGLNMIAVTRLFLHDVNIAATTALQTLAEDGYERGILAGANVVMPNITDTQYQDKYQLYENKPKTSEDSEQYRSELARRIEKIGESINWNRRGDSPHYFARQSPRP